MTTDALPDTPVDLRTMRAARLQAPNGPQAISVDDVPMPTAAPGEVLVGVHAAGITRDELDWPVDRLPAIPSYELSGVVLELGPRAIGVDVGDAVYGLTGFDRDGVAAQFATVPATLLAPKPVTLSHVEAAALPLAGLSAWQGLFVHGDLQPGQRVLIQGAGGGVGHLAMQLARWSGAHVVGTASGSTLELARLYGGDDVIDRDAGGFDGLEPVDLVFDTVGGDALRRSPAVIRDGGRLVSVAEEPPADDGRIATTYFVVEPERAQLVELARLTDDGAVRPAVDSVFPLERVREAYGRVMVAGKRGKVVIQVADA
jgi:NADPH:quinone reductase-like Zn-dependent oxidoreductase